MKRSPARSTKLMLRGGLATTLLSHYGISLTILHAMEVVLGIRLAHRQGVVPCLLNAPGHCCTRGPGNHVRSNWTSEYELTQQTANAYCQGYELQPHSTEQGDTSSRELRIKKASSCCWTRTIPRCSNLI